MQKQTQACLTTLPSVVLSGLLLQLPVHQRQWSIVAAACSELLEVLVSDRRRIAKLICVKHDLRSIHDAGKLLLKLAQDEETGAALRLMVAGAPVDYIQLFGTRTALHQASFRGNIQLAAALIGVRAQLDVQDTGGNNALIIATTSKHTQIGLALINAGAQLDVQNNKHDTALLFATARCNTEMALALINAGAQLDLQNVIGNTALIYATRLGCTSIALALIHADARLDLQNSRCWTALKNATTYGHTQLAVVLTNKIMIQASLCDDSQSTCTYWLNCL